MDMITELFCWFFISICVIGFLLFKSDSDLTLWVLEKWGSPLYTLSGKVIWIVGASSGIGEYLAYELAKQNCKLILSARREDELKRVKAECLKQGTTIQDDILVQEFDVTLTDTHPEKVQQVLKHFGQVDVLVNNAGRSQRADWESIELEVDRQLFDVNVFGIVNLTRCLLPHFLKKKTGHVVTVSSIAGKVGAPGSATYTASKHALHGYMESLRWEKCNAGINVTLICPGPVMSNILQFAFTDKVGETVNEKWSMEDERMRTDRCAYLCAVAIANKVDEAWISTQPALSILYAMQYFPSITRKVISLIDDTTFKKLRDGSTTKIK